MSDGGSHWLDDATEPEPAVMRAAETAAAAPTTPLAAVAVSVADVSPAWAAVTNEQVDAAPAHVEQVAGLGRDRAQGVESIREGWLLHRGASRVAADASPDLALLVGDWCYAAGLCLVADHGSLEDVARLARLVADVSVRADETVEALEPYWVETTQELPRG